MTTRTYTQLWWAAWRRPDYVCTQRPPPRRPFSYLPPELQGDGPQERRSRPGGGV